MKNIFKILIVLFSIQSFGQVGIGTISPDNSSALEIASTNSGFLMPRMTLAERNTIPTPIATGLLIFQTDNTPGFYYFNGISWVGFGETTKMLIFKQLPLPDLSTTNVGASSDFIFNQTVNGVNYTITRRVVGKEDGQNDIAQRLRVRYTFSPALPFNPSAKNLTSNNNDITITDGLAVICKRLNTSVLVIDTYRVDSIGSINIPWQTTGHTIDAVLYQ